MFVWVLMQVVVGHIMIEGRKPALLDSLFQVSKIIRQDTHIIVLCV